MIIRRFHTFPTLLREKLTNLKNKKYSSQQWLVRQMKDPYVEKAKQHNYRCRSAFKLLEMNDKFDILKPGSTVVDLGAAPGSWTQIAARLVNADGNMCDEQMGKVIGIDKLPIHPVTGAALYGNLDFTTDAAQQLLTEALEGKIVDLVMSDMAPNASGVKALDHENIIKLAYMALKFAIQMSGYEAAFVVKIWDGALAPQLETDIRRYYKHVKIVRPQATRDESSEKFILARQFKGLQVQPITKS